MAHVSRTELRRGKLTKEDIQRIFKEDDLKPKQLGLFNVPGGQPEKKNPVTEQQYTS
jgi:hypothetical protein